MNYYRIINKGKNRIISIYSFVPSFVKYIHVYILKKNNFSLQINKNKSSIQVKIYIGTNIRSCRRLLADFYSTVILPMLI